MAAQLQESYATLERKVEERTHQLELANLAKSRFLAAASHDLRQPLHALGLFVAQLRAQSRRPKRAPHRRAHRRRGRGDERAVQRPARYLQARCRRAGARRLTDFPIAHLLRRIEATFAAAAREKGLRLRVVPSSAWVRSDAILLERILLNLVSNAVRYTARGGVVVGCRRRGEQLRIEVWDSGPGIPEDQQPQHLRRVLPARRAGAGRHAGLGLGLAIVDRLCRLLDHPIELTSTLGKGSRFAVLVPLAAAPGAAPTPPIAPTRSTDPAPGKLIVVIDDDALVLDGMRGLLRSWGCRGRRRRLATSAALAGLAGTTASPI